MSPAPITRVQAHQGRERVLRRLRGRQRPKFEDAADPGAASEGAPDGLVGVVTVLVGAPGLLAELLLDGLIAGAAYRRLREVPVQHWLHGAVRRTWKPMLALTLSLVIAGLVAQWLAPAADSIGDLLRR